MTRARTVQALLGMLTAALLVLQMFGNGARGAEAHTAGLVGASAQAASCDHPPVPEKAASGHHWTTRNRLDPDGLPAPSAGFTAPSPLAAVPAIAASDVSVAVRYGDGGGSGGRSAAVLQVFRC